MRTLKLLCVLALSAGYLPAGDGVGDYQTTRQSLTPLTGSRFRVLGREQFFRHAHFDR